MFVQIAPRASGGRGFGFRTRSFALRIPQCLVLLALAFPAALLAQPATTTVTDETAVQPFQPLNEPLPELPETIVPGRLNAFPSQPLPADTVVSPNRQPTPLSETGSSVDVITSEYIDQISPRGGQTTVAEVLRGRLGLDVVRSGGPGGVTSVFLRGANSGQTKVLLDGIPLNDPSNASRLFDFSTLSTDNIERIEVLRGPQSMVYGSDAIGGVVNIITQRGQGPLAVRATGFGGTYNTGQTGLSASGGDDTKYYSVAGSFYSTGGISSASARNGNTEHDSFNLGTVSGRVGYNLGEAWNVDYVFRYIDAAAEIDDAFSPNPPFLPIDNLIRKNLTKGFSNRVQLSNWLVDDLIQQRVGFNLVDYDRTDTDPGFFGTPNFHGQTREVDYFASAQLTETNILSGGALYHAEEAEATFSPLARQSVQGVFVQDAFQLGKNAFGTAGARWDDTSNSGPAQTYRVTGLYRIDPLGSAFHGSIGTGFRQPSLAEQDAGQAGNPNLLPEKSKGWDIGLRQSIWDGVIAADATYFRNDFQDLIVFVFDPLSPTFGNLQNVGIARSSGVELSLLVYLTEDLWVNTLYTHDDTLDQDPTSFNFGNQLFRRPRDKVSLSVTQAFPDYGANVTLQMLYVGERIDSDGLPLEPYTVLNLAANAQLTQNMSAFLRFDNLTNQYYEEVRGFGVPLFGAYGGMNVTY